MWGGVKYDSTLAGGGSCFQPWWGVGIKYVSNLVGGVLNMFSTLVGVKYVSNWG